MQVTVMQKFDQALRERFASKGLDVVNFLLHHERKHLAVENCCKEIHRAMSGRFRMVHFGEDRKNQIIDCMASLFGVAALKHKEQQQLSDLQKLKIQEDVRKHEEFESAAEELANGNGPKELPT